MHNKIKYTLMENAINKLKSTDSNQTITLLDLGVGRANDVNKWNRLKIDNIVGIDASASQLAQAKKRSSNNKNVTLINLNLSNVTDVTKMKDMLAAYSFNLICSFYSVHYFIDNLKLILQLINVSKDCIFLATYMNLKLCMYLFNPYFENSYLYIKRIDEKRLEIKFNDTPYFNNTISTESAIDTSMILSQLNSSTYNVSSFIDYYPRIDNLPNDYLLVELMHVTLSIELNIEK